jgi:hypothetical protein
LLEITDRRAITIATTRVPSTMTEVMELLDATLFVDGGVQIASCHATIDVVRRGIEPNPQERT